MPRFSYWLEVIEQKMNFSLRLNHPEWQDVLRINKGTILQKGRHGLYHEMILATQSVKQKFGCYSWESDSIIYYIGSFAQDYARGDFKTNLQGRIHNYLQNHRIYKTGRKNTNLFVFESINKAVEQNDMSLRVLKFESLEINDEWIDFDAFSKDSNLVHSVESLLICCYRMQEQCKWNRAYNASGGSYVNRP
jgi:hypothetical protein